jgi:hypothetical protein
VNLDALRTADFSKLDTAVTKWDEMVPKLRTLSSDFDGDVKGKADKADWKGVNAEVSREFIRKAATELDEMHQQAESIRNILRDTAGELRGYQKDINDRIESERHLFVKDLGSGSFQVEVRDDAPDGTDPEPLKSYIQGKLTAATTSDSTAADVLNTMMKLNDMGFTGVGYSDRDAAAEALENAERAAELAGQDPSDLSPEEFDELNRLTGDHNGDPLFAERFTTTLGPRGALEFWAGIHDPHSAGGLLHDRLDQYRELQENLGLTFATATRSDSDAMTRWEWDMADLGDEKITVDGRPSNAYGFQAMSSLMHWGDFDDTFLDSYGNRLIQAERDLSMNGTRSANAWFDPVMGVGNLSHVEGDDGRDPFIGYMKALSHSPEASVEFFDDPFVTKDDDHEFKDEDGDKKSLSVFDYLFEERDWPQQMNSDHDEVDTGHNAMGEALEAATTGHVAGAGPSAQTPPHTQAQADLMQQIVQSIGEDDKRLTDHSVMSDSMGRMAAEYLPDINRAISNDSLGNTPLLFPLAGEQAEWEDQSVVTRFLVSVGQDPDGYAAIETGQRAYAANLMDYHLNPDLPEDQRYPGSPQETIETISRRSGEIGGTLAIGRQEATLGPAAIEDKEYQDSMSSLKGAISGGVGTGIGVGTSFIATPAVGAAVGGGASTVSNLILEEIFQSYEPDALNEAARLSGGDWNDSLDSNIYLNQRTAEVAAEAHGVPYADQVADWAREGTRTGFNDANTSVEGMADDLETDVN